MEKSEYIFTLEARDVAGVLVRITQVFARRGCNITSLNVRPEKHGIWSVIDIDTYDIARQDQILHQLEKLIDVHSVTARQCVARKKTT